MKVLVTGRNGQVGWELTRSLAPLGEVIACDRTMADLTKPDTLLSLIARVKPDVVVNAAAYTAVDKAETDEAAAMAVNGDAVGVLAREARKVGAIFVHYSTDYVFDGTEERAYSEGDAPRPMSVYGRSKLEGERQVGDAGGDWLVFRTSWVYSSRGSNFLRTMLRLATERDALRVVADQRGGPTSARMIADLTAHAIRQSVRERVDGTFESGVFHLTCAGETTWHGFASKIIDAARAARLRRPVTAQAVEPIPTSAYPTAARRPCNSVLDNAKFDQRFALRRQNWEEALALVLDDVFDREA